MIFKLGKIYIKNESEETLNKKITYYKDTEKVHLINTSTKKQVININR